MAAQRCTPFLFLDVALHSPCSLTRLHSSHCALDQYFIIPSYILGYYYIVSSFGPFDRLGYPMHSPFFSIFFEYLCVLYIAPFEFTLLLDLFLCSCSVHFPPAIMGLQGKISALCCLSNVPMRTAQVLTDPLF